MSNSFELFLLDSCNGTNILALARRGADTAIESIPVDPTLGSLVAFGRQIGKAVTGDAKRPTTNELNDFGTDLFNFIFRGKLNFLYNHLPAGAISLQILSDRPEIKEIPWEFMRPPDKPSTPHRERSVIRVHATCGIECPPPKKFNRVKVLFVSADPVDQAAAPWNEVLKTIQRTFETQMPSEVSIRIIAGSTRDDLLRAIANETFDVFHFFGHGDLDAQNVGNLVLQDAKTGKSDFLSAHELAVTLAGKEVKLAILSACLSGAGNYSNDFGVIASALIVAGVPAVIANQYSIPYKSISPFVGIIYAALAQHGDIDRAVAEGRTYLSVFLGGTVGASGAVVEWGIPTLHRLANAQQLFLS